MTWKRDKIIDLNNSIGSDISNAELFNRLTSAGIQPPNWIMWSDDKRGLREWWRSLVESEVDRS